MKLLFYFLLLASFLRGQVFWEKTLFPDTIKVTCIGLDNNTSTLYAGTNWGAFKSSDSGTNWIQISKGIPEKTRIRQFLIYQKTIYMVTDTLLFKSSKENISWEQVNIGLLSFLRTITYSPNGNLLACGNGIYQSSNAGENWDKISFDDALFINFDSSHVMYVGSSGGRVFRSYNYGTSLQNTAELITYENNGSTIHQHGITCSALSTNDEIFYGTNEGGIFYSDDCGSSFQQRNSGLESYGISDLMVDEGNHISVITFPDGFYISNNNGAKWISYSEGLSNNEPMDLLCDNQGYMFLATYDGGIYHSNFSLYKFLPNKRKIENFVQQNSYTMDSILIKNKSDSVLIVSNVTSSNKAFVSHINKFNIKPYDSLYFIYSYNPIVKGIDKGLFVFTNNSIFNPEAIELIGYSDIPVIKIPFRSISLDKVEIGQSRDTVIIIKNAGVDTLKIDSIKISDSAFSCDIFKYYINPSDSIIIKINFTPSLFYHKSYLIIYSNNFYSPDTIAIKGYGIIPNNILPNNNFKLLYLLSQNYPNPFNPTTTIEYSIPEQSKVTLKIFDVLGREITTLVNEVKPAGNYKVEFNASSLPSGIYFYRMEAGSYFETKKIILLR